MKIFDAFCFNNELDLLELRLNILNDIVDYFVIVESESNFYGQEKLCYFIENKDRFDKFKEKIISIKLPKYNFGNPLINDAFQKNMSFKSVAHLMTDEDIFMYSDADEIPNPKAIEENKTNLFKPIRFKQNFHNYYINVLVKKPIVWHGTIMATKRSLEQIYLKYYNPNNEYQLLANLNYGIFSLRLDGDKDQWNLVRVVENGGWHYTYLVPRENPTEFILNKLKNHSHVELSNDNTANVNNVENALKNLSSINATTMPWGLEKIDLNETNTHQFLLNNIDKYRYLLYNS